MITHTKRISVLVLLMIATVAWGHGPGDRDSSPSGAQTSALLTLYDQPRPVPPLHFKNAAGQVLTLADFRGRVLLVNIWATWCPSCRREMPSLDRLQAQLGGDDFQIVPISIDLGGFDAVKAFYKTLGIQHLKRYVDVDAGILDTWNVERIPTSILIGRQGRALGGVIGPREWDSQAMIDLIKRVADLHPAGNP